MSPSCLVDTTFVRIERPYLCKWEYFNKNKSDHGFTYQVVVSLGKPFRILDFSGPFKGSAADVSVFRATLLENLEVGEKVMADRGYWQEERCWTPPIGKLQQLTEKQKIQRRKVTRIRQLNERVIGRLKKWGCLNRRWNHDWELQKLCAQVAAKLTQLELYYYPIT